MNELLRNLKSIGVEVDFFFDANIGQYCYELLYKRPSEYLVIITAYDREKEKALFKAVTKLPAEFKSKL